MCVIHIHGYQHCDCIYTRAEVTTCVDFLDALIENKNTTFKPKFLNFTCKNLDKEIDGVDYMSSDKVDLSRPHVPKGFMCKNLEVQHKPLHECCPLCGNARVLRKLGKMGLEWNVEQSWGEEELSTYGSRGMRDMDSYDYDVRTHDAKKHLEHCWDRWCKHL